MSYAYRLRMEFCNNVIKVITNEGQGYFFTVKLFHSFVLVAKIDTYAAKRFVRNALWEPSKEEGGCKYLKIAYYFLKFIFNFIFNLIYIYVSHIILI